MKAWNHASASQVRTYRRCNRKWWYQYLYGLVAPSSPAAALGSAVHKALETRIKTGAWPTDAKKDVLSIAKSGWDRVPMPNNPANVEKRFSFQPEGSPVPIIGFIDLVCPDTSTIIDHKTTSSPRWMKMPEELRADPQGVIYSSVAEKLFDFSYPITFRHIYYMTKGKRGSAATSVTFFGPTELVPGLERIVETVKAMAIDAKKTDPLRVEANDAACGDYGGCPFKDTCYNHREKENKIMSLDAFSALLAKGKKEVVAINSPEGPPPAVVEEEPKGKPLVEVLTDDAIPGADALIQRMDEADQVAHERSETTPKKRGRPAKGPFLPDGRPVAKLKKGELVSILSAMLEGGDMTIHLAKPEPDYLIAPTLYIGCIPRRLGPGAIYLDDFLLPYQKAVADDEGQAHFLAIDFGKGPKLVAAAVALAAANGLALPSELIADRHSPCANAVIQALAPHYAVVERLG